MKRKSGFLRTLIASSILFFGTSAPAVPASALVNLPPKGVSQELWTAFQEVAISNLSGVDRNSRWTASPSFFITGEPTFEDSSTFGQTITEIGKYCNTIKPLITGIEPVQGVIFQFLSPDKFKTIIPETPSDATTSYARFSYRIGGGMTKFTSVISTQMSQPERNQIIQIRVLQGMGMGGRAKNFDAKMFSYGYPYADTQTASELDKQIIRLYCSTYTQSGDTAQETFDAITRAWSKPLDVPAIDLNIKAIGYKEQINYNFNFDPSKALDLQMSGIEYRILGPTGTTIKNGTLDVSTNLFKSYTVVLSGVKDKSTYTLEAFPVNAKGKGIISKSEGRPGTQLGPVEQPSVDAADASEEIIDARKAASQAIDAGGEALSQFRVLKEECIQVSSQFENNVEELYDSTALILNCNQFDEEVSRIDSKLNVLNPDNAITTDQANKITDAANRFSEELDSFIALMQDAIDELSDTERQFDSIVNLIESLNQWEADVRTSWDILNERVALLPKTSQSDIKKSQNYKTASNLYAQFLRAFSARDDELEKLADLRDPRSLPSVVSSFSRLRIKSNLLVSFENSLFSISKVIPSKVCTKSSLTLLPAKSGKCPAGYDKISTS